MRLWYLMMKGSSPDFGGWSPPISFQWTDSIKVCDPKIFLHTGIAILMPFPSKEGGRETIGNHYLCHDLLSIHQGDVQCLSLAFHGDPELKSWWYLLSQAPSYVRKDDVRIYCVAWTGTLVSSHNEEHELQLYHQLCISSDISILMPSRVTLNDGW